MDDHRRHQDTTLLRKLELQIATLIAQDHKDRPGEELDLGLALCRSPSTSASASASCERSSSSSSSRDTGAPDLGGKKPWLTLGFAGAPLGSSSAVTSPASAEDLSRPPLPPPPPPASDLRRRDDPAAVACIFCGSATRFDYFNNHRHDQPRRRCLRCKRKFTPGAKLRGEERKRLAKLHAMDPKS